MNPYLTQRLEALQCLQRRPIAVTSGALVALPSWANWRGASRKAVHAKASLVAAQRSVGFQLGEVFEQAFDARGPYRFAVVHLIRRAPRQLDSDNLEGALKAVRDGIAQALGIDDRSPAVRYVVSQARGPRHEEYLLAELYFEPGEPGAVEHTASPPRRQRNGAELSRQARPTPNVRRPR